MKCDWLASEDHEEFTPRYAIVRASLVEWPRQDQNRLKVRLWKSCFEGRAGLGTGSLLGRVQGQSGVPESIQ